MGYRESLVYIQPQRKFKKLIKAFDKADQIGYYELAGARPTSVLVLKQPVAGLPAGTKLLWLSGESEFHTAGAAFAGKLNCRCDLKFLPVEDILYEQHLEGIDLNTPAPSENTYMKRFGARNYAFRLLKTHQER